MRARKINSELAGLIWAVWPNFEIGLVIGVRGGALPASNTMVTIEINSYARLDICSFDSNKREAGNYLRCTFTITFFAYCRLRPEWINI